MEVGNSLPNLRPYQKEAVDEVRIALSKYRRVLFCAPTGAGKGFLLGYMACNSANKGKKVLIISSRTEILKQNLRYVANFAKQAAFINPKQRNIPENSIVVAMSHTLKRRIKIDAWRDYIGNFDFVIIDECHECFSDFIHPYLKKNVFLLGLSGSPQRYGKMKQLGSIYSAITETVTIKDLIRMGFLSKAHLYSIAAPKLEDVSIDYKSGEYNQMALSKRFEDKTLYKGVVSEYIRLVNGKKAICFCVSSKQAIEITKEFNDRGVSARYVLSGRFEDTDEEYSGGRDDVVKAFERNEFTVLVNVGCLVAGFDAPDVEVVIANYATVSLVKWMQSLGRGARTTATKKDFYILDCGRNYERLGKYDEDRTFCLWHDEGHSGGVQMLKTCDPGKKDIHGNTGCGRLVPTTCKVCPACGWKFPTEKDEFVMHLEEVADSDEKDLISWAAQKKLEGWKLSRILVQCCMSNVGREKEAFVEVYSSLYPNKGLDGARKYWYVWKKNVWDKIKKGKIDQIRME